MGSNPFDSLTFDGFRAAAADESLSVYAKIGFPDSYRAGMEDAILADIRRKLTNLDKPRQKVLDIGPGCSPLPVLLIDHARQREHRIFLADSAEMLDLLPDGPHVVKLPGRFPDDHRSFVAENQGQFDAVLIYSVVQYVFAEGNVFDFLDSAVALLDHGGRMLVGDIPNVAMRNRYFSSPAGIAQHRQFTGTDEAPPIEVIPVPGKVDDEVLLGLVTRYRSAGHHAFLLPQDPALPMANRREDLLIVRP